MKMGPKLQSTKYLYDFLYVDKTRVSSYLSQLNTEGSITNLSTQSSTVMQKDHSDQSDASVNAALAKGSLSQTEKDSKTVSRMIQKQFDPQWVLPVTVLDGLDEQEYIQKEIQSARIGQIVLVTGKLFLVDTRGIKELWKPILGYTKKQNRTIKKKTHKDQELEIGAQYLQNAPHMIQSMLVTNNENKIWFILNPDFMSIPAEEIAMKYGTHISGEWYCLGVLDIKKNDHSTEDNVPKIVGEMDDLTFALKTANFELKKLLGCPLDSNAITPIMVFRKIEQ